MDGHHDCGHDHHHDDSAHIEIKAQLTQGTDILSPLPRPDNSGSSALVNRRFEHSPFVIPIPFNTRSVEAELRSYTSSTERGIARILFNTWNAQKEAIKFGEIENAVLFKEIPSGWVDEWREDYSRFVNQTLDPEWRRGSSLGGQAMAGSISAGAMVDYEYPELTAGMSRWIEERGVTLAVNLSNEQRLAARNILNKTVVVDGQGSRELEKRLRAVIGLTNRDALAVERRRESLQKLVDASKLTQSAADRQVLRYSNFLLTRRSRNIARTETASAYNFGAFDSMRNAVADGLIDGVVVKKFSTAGDERVCPFCGPLDGKVVALEETFPGIGGLVPNTYVPPVHPQCRCTIIYEVLDPINQPRMIPPLPTGFAAVTAASAGAALTRFTNRAGDALNENEQQIVDALSRAQGASTAGAYTERAIVAESRVGNVQGAVGYTVQENGTWQLNNIGELSNRSNIQDRLFEQFARDSAIHQAGISIPPTLVALGLFRLLGVSEQQSENVVLTQPEVIELLQERGVSLSGN